MGPGATEYMKPFGSDCHHKMHFGGKYKYKSNYNPGPGTYKVENGKDFTLPKSRGIKISS